MNNAKLPNCLIEKNRLLNKTINKRLKDFSEVSSNDYFYELCFCLCTPQSKAKNAIQVIEKLKQGDFFNNPFNPTDILREPKHYIRFHNQKSDRLLKAINTFPQVLNILELENTAIEKRNAISKIVNGFGLKESSHFLRNIGYRGLAILDRHILKHLTICRLFDEIPKVSSDKQYLLVESKFIEFAERVGITIDELDLLFWSYETGEIIK